jgi:glycosyltransferase involved in cell wall biosynthesis
VRVVRSLVYPVPNRGFARRIANHTVFALGALAVAPATGPADVVVAESPPLFTAAAGALYAAAKRAPLVLNISDLWPESAIDLGALPPGAPADGAAALARWCHRRAARIATPTRGIVDALQERPECAGKVVHIPPAVDLDRFAAVPDPAPRERGPLRMLYAGTLGSAQGTGVLAAAAELAGPDVVHVSVAGDGPEAPLLADAVRDRGLSHVRLLGSVAPASIAGLYAESDVGVVPLLDRPVFHGALPTKMFEIMASGRPVLLSARGEAAELVRRTGTGLVVAPEDPGELAGAIRRLRDSPGEAVAMGLRGREVARQYSRSMAVDRWSRLLCELAA